MKSIILSAILAAATSAPAFSAEPIEGVWKRPNGTMIRYSAAGGGKFCGKVLNNEYKGQSIGCMEGSGAAYKGKVNKLDEGKTYVGKAHVNGNMLKLSGCALLGLVCKSENLARQ